MNHAVVTEHLADYLEGDLALDLRALVDAHLDGCEICANEVREMQQTIRLLRALPDPEPPPMIAANVMRRIRAGETQPSLLERIQRGLGSILEPSFVLPAAAMAIVALAIFVIQGRGPFSTAIGSDPERVAEQAGEVFAANSAPASIGLATEDDERSFGAAVAREPAVAPVPRQHLVARSSAPVEGANEAAATLRRAEREIERVEATLAARAPASRLDGRHAATTSERDEFAGDRMVMAPWDQRPRGMSGTAPDRPGAGGSIFGAPVLAQGFAPSAPSPTSASNRVSGALASTVSTAVPTALSRQAPRDGSGSRIEESGGEDPRDAWLARALEDPVEFAHYISRQNLAEQELWVARLAERASARGLLDEVVESLRSAGDEKAAWLAEDFSAAAESAGSSSPQLDRERP